MRLVFKPLAEQYLEAIGDYIARDNPVCFPQLRTVGR